MCLTVTSSVVTSAADVLERVTSVQRPASTWTLWILVRLLAMAISVDGVRKTEVDDGISCKATPWTQFGPDAADGG